MINQSKRPLTIILSVTFAVVFVSAFVYLLLFVQKVKQNPENYGYNNSAQNLQRNRPQPEMNCDMSDENLIVKDFGSSTMDFEDGEVIFKLKKAEFGCSELPKGLRRFDKVGNYVEGSRYNAITMTYDIETKNTGNECLKANFRLGNSSGKLIQPNNTQLYLPGSGGCGGDSYTTYENQVFHYVVPKDWKENYLFMGDPTTKIYKIAFDDSISIEEDDGSDLPENLADYYEKTKPYEPPVQPKTQVISEKYSLRFVNGYPSASIGEIVDDGECGAYIKAIVINTDIEKMANRKVELKSDRDKETIVSASDFTNEQGIVEFFVTSKEKGSVRLQMEVDDKKTAQSILLQVLDEDSYKCKNNR